MYLNSQDDFFITYWLYDWSHLGLLSVKTISFRKNASIYDKMCLTNSMPAQQSH